MVKAKGKTEIFRVIDSSKITKKTQRNFFVAKKKDELWCSDIVVTSARSSAKLRFKNGTVNLGSNARIEIANYLNIGKDGRTVMDLIYGKLRASVKSEKKKSIRFQINTPTAVMGVRGTDLFIYHDPIKNSSKHAILEGEVEVTSLKTKKITILTTGNQIETSEKITSPIKPIDKITVLEIQATSEQVKDDPDFTSTAAIKVLGPPENWVQKTYNLPDDLKDKKEEF